MMREVPWTGADVPFMKRRMDLLALRDFVLVAQHGGISAASRAAGRSKATLSRQIARLEDDLQVRLVERGASQLRLTAEGKALQAGAHELLAELEELRGNIQGSAREPEGRLRLSAPLLFSHVHLGALAAAFQHRYPKVLLEAQVEDRRVDLVDEGYDVVIRVNPAPTHGLVGRCFLKDRLVLVAAPAVAANLRERHPHTIPAVVLSSSREDGRWLLCEEGGVRELSRRVVLRLPSYAMIRMAVIGKAGAAAIPQSIVEDDLRSGALVRLGTIEDGDTQLWVLHTARRLTSPKVKAFVHFVSERFSEDRLLNAEA
jgi:DNA-binding transcriptional LysR family regulator